LIGNEIYILDQPKLRSNEIGVSKRIGITRSVDLQWRFFIKGNPFVSRR
ncbi:MAG TPA: DNA-3-methyladenine glycosylase, partial [Ignavibacteriales bacterium]|nr:DNA-3-methyladenine glycosylase [Ignavibacteriales bacterium]